MKYRDTYRIVTQVSRYVSHRDFRYRATPSPNRILKISIIYVLIYIIIYIYVLIYVLIYIIIYIYVRIQESMFCP